MNNYSKLIRSNVISLNEVLIQNYKSKFFYLLYLYHKDSLQVFHSSQITAIKVIAAAPPPLFFKNLLCVRHDAECFPSIPFL